jgi:bacteriocin biosynthesis cyclodehydratase domain-containing protein
VSVSRPVENPAPERPPGLPRTLRLAPHRSLLRRGPSSRQLGLDPRTALVVDDLPPPLARLLDELVAPVERDGLTARAVLRGAHRKEVDDLLGRLVHVGALVDAAGPERIARLRAGAVIAIVGDGPLATGMALGLASAGVGTVRLEAGAGGLVRESDLGTGLLDGDRGRPRSQAIVDAVRRVAPDVAVGERPGRSAPDVCVLADAAAPDPARVAALHRDTVTHLPVRLRDGTGVVGPLVLPGRSACLACVELHRRYRDPGWPAVTAQLVARTGEGDAATAAATAALAVAQVLAALDGVAGAADGARSGTGSPPVLGATLELELRAGQLLRRPWPPHPACTCGAPPGETCGQRERRETIMR